MINGKKVFILGAGASRPLGYPTGQELTDKVCEGLGNAGLPFHRRILDCGIELKEIDAFVREVRYSVSPSIDSFLEHRPEFKHIGKYAIAQALIQYESKDMLYTRDRNWYPYLFDILARGTKFENFTKNAIGFVTFNYDRSLEQFLCMALQSRYGKTEAECADVIKKLPIIHVYGRLNHLPWQVEEGRNYISNISPDIIKEAAREIIIINEENAHTEEFVKAHHLLLWGEQIYVLGLGYNQTNLDRLRILDVLKTQIKTVFGSTYKIKPADCRKIKEYFSGKDLQLGYEHWDTLEFLQNKLEY
jgi:hypothetical protein